MDAPERARLSRHANTAKATLERWPILARFLDDGRICLATRSAG
jgi:hypothetical protein